MVIDVEGGDVRSSVRQQVVDNIRRAIVHGRFLPGEHLSDRALCEVFKVSRTVVREAVRQLEAEGLVESVPHRGSFVKVLTVEEAIEIFDTRAVLEAWVTRRFVQLATDAQIDELVLELDDLRLSVARREKIDLVDRKQKFYDMLFAVYKNSYIQSMLNQIQNWSGQLRAAFNAAPDRLPQTIAELERLTSAIQRRDESAVWRASLERVHNVGSAALSVLRTRGDDADAQDRDPARLFSIMPPPERAELTTQLGSNVEITLSSGHRLRVDSSIDEQVLSRLISVLQKP